MTWEITIGLETHVQLNTITKIFSTSSTVFGEMPNTQANEVDMALPGTLPVLNRSAVEKAVIFGLAVGGTIASKSQFERKNYFYPDLPKAYQTTQLAVPIVSGGSINIITSLGEKTIQLTRAHMEEDAGKSVHDQFSGQSGIDLNRAGTPLIEVVTEPVMHSSEEAVAYAKALHSLVTWLDICDGNMQEGSFRCDANVSVRRIGDPNLGTRREIKNLNSFKFLQQAIDYEARWQIDQLEEGHSIVQSTVLFDSDTGETRAMRTKEDAHDYRYFPDPDLPPLEVSEQWLAAICKKLPLLPADLRTEFVKQGLSNVDAAVLTQTKALSDYYQAVVANSGQFKLSANWVMGEVSAALNREAKQLDIFNVPVSAIQLGGLIKRIADNTINHASAKQLFTQLWLNPSSDSFIIDTLIESNGLKQVTDINAIEIIIDTVLLKNPQAVLEFKSGKTAAFNSLVGQCMKLAKGKASPTMINDLLKNKLS
ncbi:MAG: aspartyl/glutamyl-tRNA amidotransferase subunit [Pseudomonadota bacterium]|jgi:aspartyl-tRNA(Asn)/glutamyl-tRNA(Gln) amidotransferase subunit B